MNHHLYDALHRCRAEQFQHDAAVSATAQRLRRAWRLEQAARWVSAWAAWSTRLANHLDARARAGRARLL